MSEVAEYLSPYDNVSPIFAAFQVSLYSLCAFWVVSCGVFSFVNILKSIFRFTYSKTSLKSAEAVYFYIKFSVFY